MGQLDSDAFYPPLQYLPSLVLKPSMTDTKGCYTPMGDTGRVKGYGLWVMGYGVMGRVSDIRKPRRICPGFLINLKVLLCCLLIRLLYVLRAVDNVDTRSQFLELLSIVLAFEQEVTLYGIYLIVAVLVGVQFLDVR